MTRRPPSDFFSEQLDRIRAASSLGAVADLACGRGRHALAAAEAGVRVVAVDRNRGFLDELRAAATASNFAVDTLRADLERPSEIPLRDHCCGAVLVFRFLHRPLVPAIQRVLASGGLLIYETFTTRQRALETGPSNPDYLLEAGELLELFAEFEVLEHWEGLSAGAEGAHVARLAARA